VTLNPTAPLLKAVKQYGSKESVMFDLRSQEKVVDTLDRRDDMESPEKHLK